MHGGRSFGPLLAIANAVAGARPNALKGKGNPVLAFANTGATS